MAKASFGQAMKQKGLQLMYPEDNPYIQLVLNGRKGRSYPLPYAGCDETQIKEIMKAQNVSQLPEIYLEFLRYLGVKSGDLFIGLDVTYFYMKHGLKESLNKILKKANHSELSDDFFVFFSHQSHTFAFFSVEKGDDPPVYLFSEVNEEPYFPFTDGPIQVSCHLSEYLTKFIRDREDDFAQIVFLNKYAIPYR